MRNMRIKLAAGVALALVTSCGGSSGSTSPSPSASASPTASPSSVSAAAYFLRATKAAPVQRTIQAPAVATSAMQALLAGPTSTERAAGFSTAIPAGTQLRSVSIAGTVATVDLSSTFASAGGTVSDGQRTAQVVTTVTQFPTVSKAKILVEGQPSAAFGNGAPMGRADVEKWLPAILVDSPAAGATISSPVRVRGNADVFEAVFFVQVQDSYGHIVATRRVMASSGTGTLGTFDVQLSYTTSRTGLGAVVVYSLSPKDGSKVNVARTPVTVAP